MKLKDYGIVLYALLNGIEDGLSELLFTPYYNFFPKSQILRNRNLSIFIKNIILSSLSTNLYLKIFRISFTRAAF